MDYTIFPSKTQLLNERQALGYVECPYSRLVELFKEPFAGDEKDIDVEWHILLENQHPIAIYNFRNGQAYNGMTEGTPTKDIHTWNVGGHYEEDFETVRQLLEGKVSFEFTAQLKASDKGNLVKRLRGIANHIEEGSTESANSSDYHSWKLERKTEPYTYPQD